MITKRFDVLGLGIVTVDDILYVDAYPHPESKVKVNRSVRQCGGLTGTALVAAARLGAKCAYAGVLGDDELSAFVSGTLAREGVNLDHLDPRSSARPIHSTIIVDEQAGTRTIFFELAGAIEADSSWPPREIVAATKVLFIDHKHAATMIRAAQIARAAGIPIVADFERDEGPRFRELWTMADHLIISRAFAERMTGSREPAIAIERLRSPARAVIVVTGGVAGCWYVSDPGSPAGHLPSYQVPVVDTTGCGDVFHGAYCAALARDRPIEERIRFAAAAAALKATCDGGQAGIPDRDTVDAFLREHAR